MLSPPLVLTDPDQVHLDVVRYIPLYIPYNSPLITIHMNPSHTCAPCLLQRFCSVDGSYMTIVEGHAIKSHFFSESLGLSYADYFKYGQNLTIFLITQANIRSGINVRTRPAAFTRLHCLRTTGQDKLRYGHIRIWAIQTGYQSSPCETSRA